MMSRFRERVAGVVWSVYAHEVGVDTTEAQLRPHACILRPALRALSLAQALDDWSIAALPPRTFYALLAAARILRVDAQQQDDAAALWCRDNNEALDSTAAIVPPPAGLGWAATIADVRNAAIVLGPSGCLDLGYLDLGALEHIADQHPRHRCRDLGARGVDRASSSGRNAPC